MRIALTGGIACGKSALARILNELGVETLDADDIVHELVPAEERRRLAPIVFADPAARRQLEARLHPLVKQRLDAWLCPRTAAVSAAEPRNFRIAVVPLLFETGWNRDFDTICCVTSSRETQIARMVATRGYARAEAEARLAAQMPVAEKAARSDYVIANDGTREDLRHAAAALVAWLDARGRS